MNPLLNNNQNPMSLIQQLRQNPMAVLSKAGMNIPQGLNDPNAIIQHLLNTGQVSQDRYNRVMQMVSQMKR